MIIVTIRTDKPEAEIGIYDGMTRLDYELWYAHRELAETIHTKLHQMLQSQSKDWQQIEGIVVYQGPGSFTGLRIGLTVANALVQGLMIPIVATQGETWFEAGLARLCNGDNDQVALPYYGAPVHITDPKK